MKDKPTLQEKNQACNFMVKSKTCEYYNNWQKESSGSRGAGAASFGGEDNPEGILDIEDLVKTNSKRRVCPYYKSRDLAGKADLVFLPYNYILDPSVCRTLPVEFKDAFVLIDEAHNISQVRFVQSVPR